jgi:hypothetical protein
MQRQIHVPDLATAWCPSHRLHVGLVVTRTNIAQLPPAPTSTLAHDHVLIPAAHPDGVDQRASHGILC